MRRYSQEHEAMMDRIESLGCEAPGVDVELEEYRQLAKGKSMEDRQSTKEIAEKLYAISQRKEPITPGDYRRLFIWGLSALLREVDSISYRVRKHEEAAATVTRLGDRGQRE